jgi:hypothetical protein
MSRAQIATLDLSLINMTNLKRKVAGRYRHGKSKLVEASRI